jgi:murein DD-endopeptidase MepM/ murein hydrolase activator NlpD
MALVACLVLCTGVLLAAPPDTTTRARSLDAVVLRFLPDYITPDTNLKLAAERTSLWDNHKIVLYDEDVAQMPDTFNIQLLDSLQGQNLQFPVRGRVTSPFGPRSLYGYSFHFGTDIKLNRGDTVVAVLDGTVRVVRYDRGYGWFVMIAHTEGIETLYGHLSKPIVKPGMEIRAGQPLGLGGNTGYSFGSHLHFEFRFMGVPFDAARVFSFEEGKLLTRKLNIDKSWFAHLIELKKVRYHVIRRGETLSHLAYRYGKTLYQLCSLNGITVRTTLFPGRALRVN